MVATIPNNSAATTYSTSTNRNLSSISTNASLTSSSSNSNSPTSSSKASNSGSTSSSKRSRKVLPIKYREYDPEKHCGVTLGNMKPCTRSLTCKTHQISLRRNVDGRSKPFDQLLADHRNSSKDPQQKHSGKQVYAACCCNLTTHFSLYPLSVFTHHFFYCCCRQITPLGKIAIKWLDWIQLATAIHRPVLIWNAEAFPVIVTNRRWAITLAITALYSHHRHNRTEIMCYHLHYRLCLLATEPRRVSHTPTRIHNRVKRMVAMQYHSHQALMIATIIYRRFLMRTIPIQRR